MPYPAIGGRKKLYSKYLQYSDYDRIRYSKNILRWLSAESAKFAGTGDVSLQFGVNVAVSGSEIFTATSHGLSAGDGPFIVEKNTVVVAATNTMTVASQPSVGDYLSIDSGNGFESRATFIASTGTPEINEVKLGATAAATATNIRANLDAFVYLTVTGTGTSIVITAATAGSAGDAISVTSSNTAAITGGGNLDGGRDAIIAAPLMEDTLYYIHSAPNGNQFLLTLNPGGTPIRPSAAGTGPDSLALATSADAIYELLREYAARVIASADDIDDLA